MIATFRPLQWTGPETPYGQRRSRWTFKAAWSDTLDLLNRELEHLDAENVVIQADFRESDIRLDGMPKANAPQPLHPGVRIAFDSKHGPLVYATDAHEDWRHNVRAIALSLQALRSVDRYGVTKRAEQYKGWKAIGAGSATPMPTGGMTRVEAAQFVAQHSAPIGTSISRAADDLLVHPEITARAVRTAAKQLHPDAGGSAEAFRRLQQAREVLGV